MCLLLAAGWSSRRVAQGLPGLANPGRFAIDRPRALRELTLYHVAAACLLGAPGSLPSFWMYSLPSVGGRRQRLPAVSEVPIGRSAALVWSRGVAASGGAAEGGLCGSVWRCLESHAGVRLMPLSPAWA